MTHLVIDLVLFTLFIAELCFNYLPKYLHEVLGVAMVITVLVHLALNVRRFFGQFKKLTIQKFFSIEVNVALGLAVLIILLTGLCMSNHLFPNFAIPILRNNMTVHNLHTSTPYIMSVLIGMHLGIHWREIVHKLSKHFKAEAFFQRRKIFFKAMALTLAVFGALGLYLNRFIDRILMEHVFATYATNLPIPIFIMLIVGSVILFAAITSIFIDKFLKE